MPTSAGVLVSIASLVMLAGGCASTPPQVVEVPPQQATEWIGERRVTATSADKLAVAFVEDPRGLAIKRVNYTVRDGDLYLWPERDKHSFEPIEFDLDLSGLKLTDGWRDRVYWLLEEEYAGPLERLGGHESAVRRARVEVVTQ